MSISTKKGDDGTTGLMFNRRVPKNHPRIEAYGTCDELNVALGLAKAHLKSFPSLLNDKIHKQLHEIQQTLVILMGELATLPEDRERYQLKHRYIQESDVETLTQWVNELESQNISFEGWATPGENLPSAALDHARVICRRSERRAFALGKEVSTLNPHILPYLNRLSDLLWLMARKSENPS